MGAGGVRCQLNRWRGEQGSPRTGSDAVGSGREGYPERGCGGLWMQWLRGGAKRKGEADAVWRVDGLSRKQIKK
jgi:hypothetical protein